MTSIQKRKYYDGDLEMIPIGGIAWAYSTFFLHKYYQGNLFLDGIVMLLVVVLLIWILCFNTKYYVLFEENALVRVFYTKKVLGLLKIQHIYKEEIPYSWIYEAYYDKQFGSNPSSFALVYRRDGKKKKIFLKMGFKEYKEFKKLYPLFRYTN